ncbi:MAG TPA: hypothetical protein VF756_29610 [Thermoanaerobaculia bacterium]
MTKLRILTVLLLALALTSAACTREQEPPIGNVEPGATTAPVSPDEGLSTTAAPMASDMTTDNMGTDMGTDLTTGGGS